MKNPTKSDEIQAVNNLNKVVRSWGKDSSNTLISSLNSRNIQNTGALISSIKDKVGMRDKVAERVGFKLLRYGVFVEKGVGRGQKISSIKANGETIAKAGQKRYPRPWFNPVLDAKVPQLADKLADLMYDVKVKALRIN
jgi:hypothetical protein